MHRGLFVATLLLIAPGAAAQVQYYGTLGIYRVPNRTELLVILTYVGRAYGCEDVQQPVLLNATRAE